MVWTLWLCHRVTPLISKEIRIKIVTTTLSVYTTYTQGNVIVPYEPK